MDFEGRCSDMPWKLVQVLRREPPPLNAALHERMYMKLFTYRVWVWSVTWEISHCGVDDHYIHKALKG